MMDSISDNLDVNKRSVCEPISGDKYVDIHCHCLPAVDDGPSTMSEALSLCRALVEDDICVVIATPHQLGRFSDCNESAEIREAVSVLNAELKSNGIALSVKAGGDVRVDERICQLLEVDKILTLADGNKYILLELPHQSFIDIEPLLIELSSRGIESIISHPERHIGLSGEPEILLKWLKHPVHLQITASSLLGEFGSKALESAWHLLSSGLAVLVATDSHDLSGRKPSMKAAFERISSQLGPAVARLVCIENPSRVLKGCAIAPTKNILISSDKDKEL